MIEPDQGPEVIGEGNPLALASCITESYYMGYGTAATHYGFTTQYRNIIWLVTPKQLRNRCINETQVHIVNPVTRKFFGYTQIDVLGYKVVMSDSEKTVIDCIDRPDLAGGIGEVANILAVASRRINWVKVIEYLERIGSKSLIRRFGWLVDYVGAVVPESEQNRLIALAAGGRRTFLGPREYVKDAIGYSDKWHLYVNVTPQELKGSKGQGIRRTISNER